MTIRLGAYVLPGDPVWLRSSLLRYYDRLDVLVVPVPASGIGWSGAPIPVETVLGIIKELDTRGIMRTISGTWIDPEHPMTADTAQRNAAMAALGDVDWILAVDNDEVVPDVDAMLSFVPAMDELGLDGLEWPMRVLFRRLPSGRFLEVTDLGGKPHVEYPGSVLVRAGGSVGDARRVVGRFGRVTVEGDRSSLQVSRPPADNEVRLGPVPLDQAIVHNSWGRSAADIRRKMATWGHSKSVRPGRYYWTRWWPSPVAWRIQRDVHPFATGLWPRLGRTRLAPDLLDPSDSA